MKENIRVLQLIDSLSVGGAERMAVNIANDLAPEMELSSLCTTRAEGDLKKFLSKDVHYFFLKKKKTIDIKAIIALYRKVKELKIDIIHAHSSSFFYAVIIKLFYPVKIVWHDHLGKIDLINPYWKIGMRIVSKWFNHTFVANSNKINWLINELNFDISKTTYLINYPSLNIERNKSFNEYDGYENDVIIVHLANLRVEKNHHLLLDAVKKIETENFHLFLIGRDFNDEYSQSVKQRISDDTILNKKVSYLGARTDIPHLLTNADIGVLTSDSEGLPVSLLEYGLAGLAVLSTDVGKCSEVLHNSDYITVVGDIDSFASKLNFLVKENKTRKLWAEEFNMRVRDNYSKDAAIKNIKEVYKNIC